MFPNEIIARRELGSGGVPKTPYGYESHKNITLHSLFGEIVVDPNNNNTVIMGDTEVKNQNTQYLLRETGILERINHNNRILDGVTRPASYLHEMNIDIQRISKDVATEFNNELLAQYNLGKPIEECRRIALEYAKKIKDEKMKFHNSMFPTSLTNEVMGRLDRQNSVGSLR